MTTIVQWQSIPLPIRLWEERGTGEDEKGKGRKEREGEREGEEGKGGGEGKGMREMEGERGRGGGKGRGRGEVSNGGFLNNEEHSCTQSSTPLSTHTYTGMILVS